MRRRALLWLALVGLGLSHGCIDLRDAPDGAWICDEAHPCPAGFYCGADQLCRHGAAPKTCDCPAPSDPCQELPCEDGVCGAPRPVAAGTDARQQSAGDCVRLVCDEAGHATPVADDADAPALDEEPCNDRTCAAGKVVTVPRPGEACGTGFCNTSGACADCAPGSHRCGPGGTLDSCGDDGEWRTGAPCPSACLGDRCVDCAPGSLQCDGDTPQSCSADGHWVSGAACSGVCTSGVCAAGCEPGSTQCVAGNQVETCGGDHKWGDDQACTYVCSDGQCGGECTPGVDRRCSGTRTQSCGADGHWGALLPCDFACTGKGTCSGSCVPGARQCKGTTNEVQVCDDTGAWQDAQACASVCSLGQCTGVCTVGSHQCKAGSVDQPQTCINGNWQDDANPCPHVCSGAGQCTGDCKPPFDKQCQGSTLVACKADGSWDTANATECPFVCDATQKGCAGSCKPGSASCASANSSRACDASGNPGATTSCPFVCNAQTGLCDGECVPGTARCGGAAQNQPQSCDAFGHWNTPGTACTFVCDAGQCSGACTPNDQRCKPGSSTVPQRCNAQGAWVDQAACSVVCLDKIAGCAGCVPNTRRCNPSSAKVTQVCTADGVWQDDATCQVTCIAASGQCGACVPGALTCTGNQPQKCDDSGVNQNNGAACAFGCSGAGVCGQLTAPTPVATVDGSDLVVTWTAPAFASVSCVMERSKDGGAFAHPSTARDTCPAGFSQPCSDDVQLVRGSYRYRVTCSGGGQTVSSAATVALSPNLELCATTYTKNGLVVDAVSPTSIKTERTVTATGSNAPFVNSWGIASDVAKGEIWVSSNDSNVISVFSRTANDPTGLTGARTFYASPEGATSTLRPDAIALFGANEIIVAMRASPYYLAGYSRTFTSSPGTPAQLTPLWYLKGTAAGLNAPASLATDGSNLVFVGNPGSHQVVVYKHDQLVAAAASNHTAMPAGTVLLDANNPVALAVDAQAGELFVGDASAQRIDVIKTSAPSGTPTYLRSIYKSGSIDPGITVPSSLVLDGGQLYVLNRDTGIVSVMSNQADVAAGSIAVSKLLTADFGNSYGMASCN